MRLKKLVNFLLSFLQTLQRLNFTESAISVVIFAASTAMMIKGTTLIGSIYTRTRSSILLVAVGNALGSERHPHV
jgi:hypothetical protein